MKKRNLLVSNVMAMALLLFILPQCAKYKPSPLPYPAGHTQEIDGVQVVSRQLSDEALSTCFDTKEAQIKYSAVQIYVKNNRNKPIVLSANKIDMPLESSKIVADKIHRNTVGRAGGYGLGALFLWPLIIPAAVDGAKSHTSNRKIDMDVKVKVLGQNETVIIQPKNAVNKVFFVPKESTKREFSISLVEQDSLEEINFLCIT